MSNTVLIIDDNADIRDLIVDTLKDEGYVTKVAHNVESALNELSSNILPNLVILDIWLNGHHMDGIGLLKRIKKHYFNMPVVMISGHANIEIAANTIKLGAYDFLEKPFKADRLLITVKRAIESSKLLDSNAKMRNQNLAIIGNSRFAVNLRDKAKSIANSNSRVLIKGEAGVGKKTFAKFIHACSPRSYSDFVEFNTLSMNDTNFDSNIFSNNTFFQRAEGGTVFFDEILDIPLNIQSKLLEIMQSDKGNDIRFLAGTERNCDAAIADGRLNNSFYLRIAVHQVDMIPLRERKQDIPILAEDYLNKLKLDFIKSDCFITDEAIGQMLGYDWPGNLRELYNVIEGCVIHYYTQNHGTLIDNKQCYRILPEDIRKRINIKEENYALNMLNMNYKEAKRLFDQQYLKVIIAKFGGNIAKTAQFIGMDRAALHRKIKLLKIRVLNN